MRFRSLAVLLSLAAAAPVAASTVSLKVQTNSAAPGLPVRVTVKALSRVGVTLPAEPVVYVDEGSGFKVRPDLHCRLAEGTSLRLEADHAYTATCDLPLAVEAKTRIRLSYKLGETVSTSNSATLSVTGPATARAAQ
jgi:hypothetical protein